MTTAHGVGTLVILMLIKLKAPSELRVTEHTELGDNASVKNPPKLPTTPFPNRNRRKCSDAAPAS